MRFLTSVLVALLLLVLPGPWGQGAARAAPEAFVPPLPIDMDKVDVYLVTVGRGDQIYGIFGHAILRVIDHRNHLDMSFNWGIFDFNDPSFLWSFYIGDLNYMMEITDTASTIEGYKDYEHRRVTQDHINLTAKQKEVLYRRLIWNSKPENLHYQYKQVRDNCSTKPRDFLDEALGGLIKKAYADAPGRSGFRPFIRDGARQFWWADIGMDMLLNSTYDVPLTKWEEMFLPAKLREHLLSLPAVDDAGQRIPGKNLLDDTTILVDLPEPLAARDPYFGAALLLILPGLLLWLTRAPYSTQSSRRWIRALGGVVALFGVWSGMFGTSMTTNWLISRYEETWHDANLWLMWPLDWVFALAGLKLLFSGRAFVAGSRWSAVTVLMSRAHLASFAVLLVASLVGLVHQDVSPILATTGIAGLLVYGLLARRTV